MICNQCNKPLNKITIVCDRCGTELVSEKKSFTFEDLNTIVLETRIENKLEESFAEEIRRAYYLTSIYKEESKASKKNIEKYFDYIYLRILYERDKNILLTERYEPAKALMILTSLVNMKYPRNYQEYLIDEFNDVYYDKEIPDFIKGRVENIHITNYNPKKAIPKKNPKLLMSLIKENKLLFKHAQSSCKKRLKTLKYRIKKGRKK